MKSAIYIFGIGLLLCSVLVLVTTNFQDRSDLIYSKRLRVLLSSMPQNLSVNDRTSDLNSYRILTAVNNGLTSADHLGELFHLHAFQTLSA